MKFFIFKGLKALWIRIYSFLCGLRGHKNIQILEKYGEYVAADAVRIFAKYKCSKCGKVKLDIITKTDKHSFF